MTDTVSGSFSVVARSATAPAPSTLLDVVENRSKKGVRGLAGRPGPGLARPH